MMEKDKGYAWLILIVAFSTTFLLSSVLIIPSWYIIEYKNAFDISYAISGLPSAVNSGFMLIMSVPAGLFVKYLNCKKTGLIGGFCSFLGVFICAFAPNLSVIIIAYGIICSFGLALSYSAALDVSHNYFKKYEASASNIVMSGFTVSFAALMPCLNLLIQEYGWRGAHLIQSGVVLHLIVCSLLFRPLNTYGKEHKHQDANTNNENIKCSESLNKNGDIKMDNEDSYTTDNIEVKQLEKKHIKISFKSMMAKLDLSLFSSLEFVLFCLVSLLVAYIDEITTFTIAKLCDDLDIDRKDAGLIKASSSLASIIFTVINSFCVNIKWVNPVLLNSFYHFGLGICLILINFAWNFASSLSICILLGTNYSGVYGLKYYVLSKIVTDEKRPMAIGWCQAVAVVSCFVGIPLAGLMYEITGSHNLAYYSAGFSGISASLIILFVEILIRRKKRNDK